MVVSTKASIPAAGAAVRKHRYVLGVGSNLGDRAEVLRAAAALLPEFDLELIAHSSVFETAPEGGIADLPFLNAAWLCSCDDLPRALLAKLHRIERQFGRTREQVWGNRTLDLDILLWKQGDDSADDACRRYADDRLIVPHPRLLTRSFALKPAAEVAPDWIHPDSSRRLQHEPMLQVSL